jgi:hypothetical protein
MDRLLDQDYHASTPASACMADGFEDLSRAYVLLLLLQFDRRMAGFGTRGSKRPTRARWPGSRLVPMDAACIATSKKGSDPKERGGAHASGLCAIRTMA